MRSYGYDDAELVGKQDFNAWKWVPAALAVLLIAGVWLALNQKLLFGQAWLSETYDNEDWRTNEGNLHTYGAWDLEAHIWKTEYIKENFPNFLWNPYWYLGMPLLKYYQSGFYMMHLLVIKITGMETARAALMMIIISHLLAAYLTFLVCYMVSRRIWVSALCSVFVIANTFITLRSYGWEPITVIFLFLYPLGLLLFFKEPLRPFRFWLVLVLGISYLSHPLLWFSLCMTMGVYLASIAVRKNVTEEAQKSHYMIQFFGAVLCSLLIGAVQFLPQITYDQATSGAHMGVKYLPYYQVPPNIISLKDFFFDAANLKGPGPIIMISFFLLIAFGLAQYTGRKNPKASHWKKLQNHELVAGLSLVLGTMVLFYYMELYNIFPMNFLRSIQYHRIIPEFIIAAAVLVAAISNLAYTYKRKVMYYSMLATFVLASFLIVYQVQAYWVTTDSIHSKPEFIYDKVPGRISFPYTDQSLAVRNSFTKIPQAYGYYEQGITNPFNDEIFSVSSGFHNANLTLLYLKAANIGRLYVNMEEGERDKIVISRMKDNLDFVRVNASRYSYFEIPLKDPSFVQAVSRSGTAKVKELSLGCRIIFKEKYCGSRGEEFVSTDTAEISYLSAYVDLLEESHDAKAEMIMDNPNHYSIRVRNAKDTSIVIKMTYDPDFSASVNGKKAEIEPFGPYFMLINPGVDGDYSISLKYGLGWPLIAGLLISAATLLALSYYFIAKNFRATNAAPFYLYFRRGDMR